MSQPSAKRQRIEDKSKETRCQGKLFQDDWNELYFFIKSSKGHKCLICKDILAVNKKSNVLRHYETLHKQYHSLSGEEKRKEIAKLSRESQQTLLFFFNKKNEKAEKFTQASYALSAHLAKNMKAFSKGEFIKECLIIYTDILFPEKSDDVHKTCLL